VEVDAIPPSTLRTLVEDAILNHLDLNACRALQQVEQREKAELWKLADSSRTDRGCAVSAPKNVGAAFSNAGSVDLVTMTKDSENPRYDVYLAGWAAGWDAAAGYYQPQLARAESDADRIYVRAYNDPATVKKIIAARVDAGLADYAEKFLAGEVQ